MSDQPGMWLRDPWEPNRLSSGFRCKRCRIVVDLFAPAMPVLEWAAAVNRLLTAHEDVCEGHE